MDEDEVLGKITRLLEQGCTMLATHHDCGAPLFRCRGEIVCPVCSFQGASEKGTIAQQAPSFGAAGASGPDINRARPDERDEVDKRDEDHKDHDDYDDNKDHESRESHEDHGRHEDDEDEDQDRRESHEDEGHERRASPALPEPKGRHRDRSDDEPDLKAFLKALRSSIIIRLREVSREIEREEDLDKLRRQLDCLEALLRVLRALRS